MELYHTQTGFLISSKDWQTGAFSEDQGNAKDLDDEYISARQDNWTSHPLGVARYCLLLESFYVIFRKGNKKKKDFMSRLTPFIISARQTNLFFSYLKHFVPQLKLLHSVLNEETLNSSTKQSEQTDLFEYQLMMQIFPILLLHKIHIEYQMTQCLRHSDLKSVRSSLREWHSDEATFLARLKKSELESFSLTTLMGVKEQKLYLQEMQQRISNPFIELETLPVEAQNAALVLTADQIVLGESYVEVSNYLKQIYQRALLLFNKLPHLLRDSEISPDSKILPEKLLTYIKKHGQKAADSCRQKEYRQAFLFYTYSILVLLKSFAAPSFDLDHAKWRKTLMTLNINMAKVMYYLEEEKGVVEISAYRWQWKIAYTSALIYQDKEQIVKMRNWERPKVLKYVFGSTSFFSSDRNLPISLVDLINDYAEDTVENFTLPSGTPEVQEAISKDVDRIFGR